MLAIRLQRTGRSGHAQFRFIVQDSHLHPKRGKVVAYLGSYNPHTKQASLDVEKAKQFLSNGAQPSDKVARLFKAEGIKLPAWVKLSDPKERVIRNPEKLRRNRPAEPIAETPAETAESASEAPTEPIETEVQAPASEETPTGTPSEEAVPEAEVAQEPAAESTTEAPNKDAEDAPSEQ